MSDMHWFYVYLFVMAVGLIVAARLALKAKSDPYLNTDALDE